MGKNYDKKPAGQSPSPQLFFLKGGTFASSHIINKIKVRERAKDYKSLHTQQVHLPLLAQPLTLLFKEVCLVGGGLLTK